MRIDIEVHKNPLMAFARPNGDNIKLGPQWRAVVSRRKTNTEKYDVLQSMIALDG